MLLFIFQYTCIYNLHTYHIELIFFKILISLLNLIILYLKIR